MEHSNSEHDAREHGGHDGSDDLPRKHPREHDDKQSLNDQVPYNGPSRGPGGFSKALRPDGDFGERSKHQHQEGANESSGSTVHNDGKSDA